PVGGFSNGNITALLVHDDGLYIGGIGGNVHHWDGTQWRELGDRPVLLVPALVMYGGPLVASIAGLVGGGVFRWNGTRWRSLGSGLMGTVHAIAVQSDSVYVGGAFMNAAGDPGISILSDEGI